MKTKICNKCKIEKPISEFHKRKDTKDGLGYKCKGCTIIYGKKYYKENKVKIKKYSKEYIEKNKEHFKQYMKDYEQRNAQKLKARKAKWYKKNAIERRKKWKEWSENNREKINKYKREYGKEKRLTDPIFRLKENTRSVIRMSLRRNKNSKHWEDLVGYTLAELKTHLEKQFKEGMTWDNYGEWVVDHKIPKSLFNITSAKCKGFKKCWALENLQPMWKKENLEKHNKLFT